MTFCLRFLSIVLLLLTGCSPLPYQPARDNGLQSGYLEEEIAPGVFVIEVRQPGSLRLQLQSEETVTTLHQHWQRRANELCRYGFRGNADVIMPADARLQDFRCSLPECQRQPLVSGIAWCHQRYQL